MSMPAPDPDARIYTGPSSGPPSGKPPSRRPSNTTIAAGVAAVVLGIGSVVVINGSTAPESAAGTDTGDPSGDLSGTNDDSTATGEPATASTVAQLILDDRSLDGSGNNLADPTLGAVGEIYPREAAANYADGIGEITTDRPDERYLSNRIFNDVNQNVFSENGVTHWSYVWGQFLDHSIGLRASDSGDDAEDLILAYDGDDPLEAFTNDLGVISTTRSAVAEGTGIDTPREQVNVVSSYLDAWNVYGGTDERLDWLREGPLDGDPTNNGAHLITDDGYLPTADSRPDADSPAVDLMGRLLADPSAAVIAGDVRANDNIGLTAVHTLFVREHNRIVDELPDTLDEQTKFTIARRIVIALEQYITYNEFLPSMGVDLDPYTGYDPTVDPSITNEFATVGYRAHSQIHGEFEAEIPTDQLTDDVLARFEANGIEVETDGDSADVAVPLNVAFGNPGLLTDIGLGNMLAGLSSERAYANDEQIDNQLRSVLFQIPGPDVENPMDCLDGAAIAGCFSVVNDLGALDVARGYDHGMPSYNDLRVAYGLAPVSSFTELTGEATEEFPDGLTIDDPAILDFVSLADADGNPIVAGSDAAANDTVEAVRRTTTAARLKGVFGTVDRVDAFTGMVSEPHVPGAEFGELQLAMWTRQFEALRDGDRFFYGNDPALDAIAEVYGIDFRRSLSEVIAANTDADPDELPANVFLLDDGDQVVDVPQVVAEQTNEIAAEQKEQPDEGGERRADRPRDGRRERDRDRPRRPRPPRPGT